MLLSVDKRMNYSWQQKRQFRSRAENLITIPQALVYLEIRQKQTRFGKQALEIRRRTFTPGEVLGNFGRGREGRKEFLFP